MLEWYIYGWELAERSNIYHVASGFLSQKKNLEKKARQSVFQNELNWFHTSLILYIFDLFLCSSV